MQLKDAWMFALRPWPLDQLQDMFGVVSLCHSFYSASRYYAAGSANWGTQGSTCMWKQYIILSPSDEWSAINFSFIKCNRRDLWFIPLHCESVLFPKRWNHFKMKGISTDPYRPFHIFFRNLWGLKMKLIFFVRKFN